MIWMLLACGGSGRSWTDHVEVEVAVTGSPVIDPKLGGQTTFAVNVRVPQGQGCPLTVVADNAVGQQRAWALDGAGDLAWDGTTDDGTGFDPGPVRVAATAQCDEGASAAASADLWVTRLGLTAVSWGDHPDDAPPITLAYHKLDVLTPGITVVEPTTPEYLVVSGEEQADLDLDDGSPRPTVAPWTNPDMPPWGAGDPLDASHNVPAAYVAGARARLTVTAGATAVAAGAQIVDASDGGPALRLAPEGMRPSEGAWTPGATVTVDTGVLSETLGRYEVPITWRWQAQGTDGTWVDVPGSLTTTHEVFILAEQPVLLDGTADGYAPPYPWVGVLADTAPALQGLPPDTPGVLDALRDMLNGNDYLRYDPSNGSYSEYDGPYIYWDSISSDLSGWLDRSEGLALYCHSVSCLLSTLAGSVGVDAPQQVIGVGFTTNLTRAAGSETWQRWSFNSHSVVSPDEGATIWDASIDLDGDDDPYHEPIDEVAPKGLDGEEYLWRLTYDSVSIVNSGHCYIY